MNRPPGNPFKTLPITSFAGFDTVYSINATLRELELGVFRQAAILSDATGRDDRITAVTSTRVGALLAANLDVKPADDRVKSAKYADMLGGTEDAPGRWDRMFASGTMANLLRSGLHLNMGIAEILWWYEDELWWPRLKFWHSQFVRWDIRSERYRLITAQDGEIDLPQLDDGTEAEGRWFMWCPFGYSFAWLGGLIRSLAPMFMRRMWINRDWARYNEVHGLPITKAIVPGDGGQGTEDEEFFASVANRGVEPTILLQQGEDGNKYDVELLEATAKTYETFKDAKGDVNTDMAVVTLGQNLSTESKGGGIGSGDSKVQNLVRLDKAREDAAIATAIYQQVLRPWARFNFGDPNLAPRPIYRVDPPEDEAQKTAILKSVGDGIASLTAAKVPVNIRETAEEYGIELLSEEEQAAAEAVAKEEAAAQQDAQHAAAVELASVGKPVPVVAKKPGPAALGSADVQAEVNTPRPVLARYQFQGLPIAVDHPRGSTRVFHDAQGLKTGEAHMLHDYGFIEGHVGGDGEALDCYVGPNEDASQVHVVHQLKAPEFTKHDEDKIMLGFNSPDAAKSAFIGHRPDGEKAFGGMSIVPVERFKAKLKRRTSDGKIRATASVDETFAAIMALADRGVAELRARTVRGKKTKRYPDKLAEKAVALGARALATDITGVKAQIKDATSFADLEKRLVSYYRDKMDPEKLAKVVHRTRLMANLSGRLGVIKGA